MEQDDLERKRADLMTASELTRALLREPELPPERRMALEMRLARVQAEIKRLGADMMRYSACVLPVLAFG